ncbi:MAG: M10 family metallopeptidase C-terminal domain-containing protein [Paracoccus sp. (in: a-proteobacteria)]|nr:M10 family metallopeptidase C-terminal domain-containing protein [Paracoccus sp. (in: a-proteobacteria)]
MAQIIADQAFDQTKLDLSDVFYNSTWVEFQDDVYVEAIHGTFEDALIAFYYDDYSEYGIAFAGRNFTLTDSYEVTGGTLEAIFTAIDSSYYGLESWYEVYDLNLPMVDVYSALKTFSTADDQALIARAFSGNDLFDLSYENDRALGLNGNDTLYGNAGADTLSGGNGNDMLYGGTDNDVLMLDAGRDVLNGGAGQDWVRVSGDRGARIKLAMTGVQDTNYGQDRFLSIENISGAQGHDSLFGDDNINRIFGNNGNDLIFGRGGADWLDGGAGSDRIEGNFGNDTLVGGQGNDTLLGGIHDDRLHLDQGDDLMDGGTGQDWLIASGGSDIRIDLAVSGAQNTLQGLDTVRNIEHIQAGGGDDRLLGNQAANTIIGGAGHDSLFGRQGNDQLHGKAGDDRMDGGLGNDTMTGGDGDDLLRGKQGSDRLDGGAGNDSLEGGIGRDVLTGGGGADVFVFDRLDQAGTNYYAADQILDFQTGVDRIDLRGIDADLSHAGNDAFILTAGTQFLENEAGQIIVRHFTQALEGQGETRILMDVDGDGQLDAMIRLSGLHDLGADDFFL